MTVGHWLLVFGFGCLVVVVLTHIAEELNLFPVMGWGLPDSPGHYLDLISAVLGTMLFSRGHYCGGLLATAEMKASRRFPPPLVPRRT